MQFRDQILERLIRKWEALKEAEEQSSSDDSDDGMIKMPLRERYILQERYIKYQQQAAFLWDAFTSGNKGDKLKGEQAEKDKEEKEKEKYKKKIEEEQKKNAKKLKRLNAIRNKKGEETLSDTNSFESDMTDYDGVVRTKKEIQEKLPAMIDQQNLHQQMITLMMQGGTTQKGIIKLPMVK